MWSLPANRSEPAAIDLACVAMRATAWADPVDVASAFAGELHVCVLLSADGWSYVLRSPDAVVEQGGIEALNRVWEAPEMLPSMEELELPALWLARTADAA